MDLNAASSNENTNRYNVHYIGRSNSNLAKFEHGADSEKQRYMASNTRTCFNVENYTSGDGQDFHQSLTETVQNLTSRIEDLIKLTIALMVIIVVMGILLSSVQYRVNELEHVLSRGDNAHAQSKSFQAGLFHREDDIIKHRHQKAHAAYERTQGFVPERLDRMKEAHVNRPTDQRSGLQDVRNPDELSRRRRRSTEDARKCSNLSIRGVLENYCRSEKYKPVLAEEAFFPAVFDDNLSNEISSNKSTEKDPNCLMKGTSENPEKWCLGKTITFRNRDSPVRVFRGAANDLITFNNNTGTFTVRKSGSFLIHGFIPIISDKIHKHLLGLYVNNQTMLTCPSGVHGIVRTDNAAGSERKRICNLSGVLVLKKGQLLSLRTMVPNLELQLELPATPPANLTANLQAYLSWILLSAGSSARFLEASP